jgi:hypothetical protein
MDKYYFIILLGFLIIFTIISHIYYEKFPEAGYVRNNTMGKLLPRARDRDTGLSFQPSNENDLTEKNENEVDQIQHINLDETSGNYVWNSYLNFPYGGYIYNNSYPVYLASDICPSEKPYYDTMSGKCIYIDINIVKNSPSGAPNKIFNSDLPGNTYYNPSNRFTVI